ncbi:Bro-N domain-containing protein [Streptomyces roseicoloratus]|uniref:Bro-N domain-containing protein n=1 Tax=Streptomyces roseicoloratus TaxID=2508722 RepID=A0ABY9RW66_9ACTN|nr:Bro-N domain-containing protein [Streptomyces roseicoloratus]WMX46009.1 Bro-N domain-containing protein [Streptomyces roseicoloratus]
MNPIDAIDIDDFVYAATGVRLRRLTLPDGTHWFPAVDAARSLGFAGAAQALRTHVGDGLHATLAELPLDTTGRRRLRKSTRMVSLEGLVQLVNASPRAETAPFKDWVAEVVTGIQRDGSYGLEPSSVHLGFVLPPQLLDVLVRLEERALRLDDDGSEYGELLREAVCDLRRIAASVERIALPAQRSQSPGGGGGGQVDSSGSGCTASAGPADAGPADAGPAGAGLAGAGPVARSPQELIERWRARNAVVGADVHAVAAYLAPALVRGGVRYRLEEVARRTGLTADRVRDCVRTLVERGCMRHAGGTGTDGGLLYALP